MAEKAPEIDIFRALRACGTAIRGQSWTVSASWGVRKTLAKQKM
jgi:hypothetical protein